MAAATIGAAAIGGGVIGTMPALTSAGPDVVRAADALDSTALYNEAQAKFAAGDVPGGLASLKKAIDVAPADAQALALQVVWADQAGDAATGRSALRRLSLMNPALATTARNIVDGVANAAAIVPDVSPKAVSGNVAIVVLGYGLNGNGTMANELVRRVTAGRAQAELTSAAPVVVTGGAPKKGVTEAAAMRKWLVEHDVADSRILVEDKSGSTVANAQNTAAILAGRGIRDIVLVTSPNHIRRAAADFAATGLRVVQTVTTPTELSKYAAPLPKERQSGIRLEATRTARIPATRTAGIPLPQNLPDPGPGLIPEIGSKLIEILGTGSSN
ncbi:YdcF family protein [Gordonia sp. ABSL1-1]|uniref:YdcF family protein n=1 Tax=Gordonia sp. ABSL1-1 TaxID=3053923 RepID=UPI002573563D|nr:YdcF family protein [Gordonia sp. ABSL1-1]MDL9935204.1 YdcF family protein [Gordonia sp. ABSL1-1]